MQPKHDVAIGKPALLQAKTFPNDAFNGVSGDCPFGLFLPIMRPRRGCGLFAPPLGVDTTNKAPLATRRPFNAATYSEGRNRRAADEKVARAVFIDKVACLLCARSRRPVIKPA